jgi:hypothetical protein
MPVSDAGTYRIEYATEGGPELGPGLHETETSLRIDLATGTASFERRQPISTEGGDPVGTFSLALSAEWRTRLHHLIDNLDLQSIPPGTAGGPGVSVIRLRVTRAQRAEASFSNRDIPTLERLEPVLSALDDLGATVAEHPLQAIRLEVRSVGTATEAAAFDVIATNVGRETLVLVPPAAHPGGAGFPLEPDWAGVQYAHSPEEKPGFTAPPLEWHRVIAQAQRSLGQTVVLAPGAALSLRSGPWTPTVRRERHLVQAIFSSYSPLSVLDGHPVFRGRALSAALEITASK